MKTLGMNGNGEFRCPKCGADLQIHDQNTLSWPQFDNKQISVHLHCSDNNEYGCEYDCYDCFDFRIRVDKDNPAGEQAA